MSLTPNPPLNPKITRFYVPANNMDSPCSYGIGCARLRL